MRSLVHHIYSACSTPRTAVLRSAEEWVAFYGEMIGAPLLPADTTLLRRMVDFDQDMVLVAAMGTRSSGGHDITISDVTPESGGLLVTVTTRHPQGMATMSLTAPVDTVVVPRVDGPVTFRTVVGSWDDVPE